MEAPFGILFLKKVELYNLVRDLRDKSKTMTSEHLGSHNPVTWYVEEKILKWTYHGHKYLLDPIKISDFKLENSTKLGDWELLDINKTIDMLVEYNIIADNNEFLSKAKFITKIHNLFKGFKDTEKLNEKKIREKQDEIIESDYQQALKQPYSIFKNMVARGFAIYKKNGTDDEIIINKEGLLLGEIIYKTSKNKIIYEIYSRLVDSLGAWVLLIIFSITFFVAILYPFLKDIYNINFNIYSELIKSLLNIIRYLFSLLFHLF